jgi:hypothetical protein
MKSLEQNPPAETPPKKKRAYNGPAKGSDEAKRRMTAVRAAQWAKNGLKVDGRKSVSKPTANERP